MADVPMFLFSQGDFAGALLWIFNSYIGYGIIWLLIGVAIFSTVQEKSKSAAISGLVFALFLFVINTQLPVELQAYFTIISGVTLFMVLYKLFR